MPSHVSAYQPLLFTRTLQSDSAVLSAHLNSRMLSESKANAFSAARLVTSVMDLN